MEVRIDKWLWAVRIFKTRSMASDACKKGRVLIDGMAVKPSRMIKVGDSVFVRKLPVVYSYEVKQLIENRVSAKLAVECYSDVTSPEELQKLQIKETIFVVRDKGTGRPTKKERRLLDKIKNA